MPTITQTERELVPSGTSVTHSSHTSGTLSLVGTWGGHGVARVKNGGTGPGAGCHFKLYQDFDGIDRRLISDQAAGVLADAIYDFPFVVPVGVQKIVAWFGDHTNQPVNVDCYLDEITSIT